MSENKAPGAMTQEMKMVHTALRREFGLLAGVVAAVADGDHERVAFVVDHIELIGSVVFEHHHSEDLVIWPGLTERGSDDIAPLVHGMEDHHKRIDELLTDLRKTAATWRTDPSAAHRDTIIGIVEPLVSVLREHLGAEEEYVLPLIEKYITGDEWNAMVAQGVADLPPELVPLVLGMTMYEGEPGPVKDALASVPEEARATVAETAERAYAEHAKALYGTPTPPRESELSAR